MDKSSERWEELLERRGPALVLLARQYGASRADAEDIVHEGFVRFWRSRTEALDPDAYLFVCVKHAALNFIRGAQRRETHERQAEDLLSQSRERWDGAAEFSERQDALHAALSRLPVEQREVLILKTCSDLTFPQIATALGISPNTAASRHRYALEALRRMLVKEVPLK